MCVYKEILYNNTYKMTEYMNNNVNIGITPSTKLSRFFVVVIFFSYSFVFVQNSSINRTVQVQQCKNINQLLQLCK